MSSSRHGLTMRPTEQLRNFLTAATELEANQFVQEEMSTKLTISWNREGMTVTPTTPTRPLLVECFTAVRQFASNERDPVFLDTIFNLCERHITDAGLRVRARSIRQSWTNVKRSTYIRRGTGKRSDGPGRPVPPTEIAELWEGHVFHGNPQSREALAAMDPLERALLDNLFYGFLIGTVEVILYTASFLGYVLDHGLVNDEPIPRSGT